MLYHLLLITILLTSLVSAQTQSGTSKLRTGRIKGPITLDGHLDDPGWKNAPSIPDLVSIDPVQGGKPTGQTKVMVIADQQTILIGIRCEDPQPEKIVSYTVARDNYLSSEDHIKLVLGTFLDGQSGYVFAVNPSGARYDALIANRGEGENKDWDGIWEAKTQRGSFGWSTEIRIPINSLAFKKGLSTWHFNVQRRIQRLQETNRWAGINRDFKITHLSRAGKLIQLPKFELGLGLELSPVAAITYGKETKGENADLEGDASLDLTWRFTPALIANLTFNTDFAETEADTRRTNLTRFPLFFPEKRRFFLEGAEAFDFGLGLGSDIIPFHSRRIGLVGGKEVPLLTGAKLTGHMGRTRIGALITRTGEETAIADDSTMGIVRVRQDILTESSVGFIGTTGDPTNRDGSWLAGMDFTYQTSKFMDNKNFLVGIWGLSMDRESLGSNSRSAVGFKIDYPNDRWDVALYYKRIGESFDPSLGFVPRKGINKYYFKADFSPRPDIAWLRKANYEAHISYITDLKDNLESYSCFLAPINWDLESGDDVEFNVYIQGERLDQSFEIADNIDVPIGDYDWVRYGFQLDTASKRQLQADIEYRFGPFYDGHMTSIEADLSWHPIPLFTLSASAENNRGHISAGSFDEDAYTVQAMLNFSPDLTFSTYVQYDTDSDSVGTNTRLRWDISPLSTLYFVFNYNLKKLTDRYRVDTYDTILKLQYCIRF